MKYLWFCLCIVLFFSCKSEPQPIVYGKDQCEFCKMNIMDANFGSELVTKKGKVFKFDDAGCMVKFMKNTEFDDKAYKFIELSAIDDQSKFVSFQKAFFVSSENLHSPMLGNVGAFETKSAADAYCKTDTLATQISWDEVKSKIE